MKTTPTALPSLKEVPEAAWQKLAEKKIYFGHQSVGFNLIDGIKDVLKENPKIRLNLQETDDPALFSAPLLAHSRVGQNMDPGSKIQAFAGFMDKGLGDKADIAFFKFCYVDFTPATETEKVFAEYRNALTALQNRYPRTTFLHLTVPLTTVPTGFKPWIKGVIKKTIGRPSGHEDNIQREKFNQLLRRNYAPPTLQPPPPILFDLAALESTFPDGTRIAFEKDGEKYYSLVPDYASDGRHLNEKGRKFIAEQFLIFLAGRK